MNRNSLALLVAFVLCIVSAWWSVASADTPIENPVEEFSGMVTVEAKFPIAVRYRFEYVEDGPLGIVRSAYLKFDGKPEVARTFLEQLDRKKTRHLVAVKGRLGKLKGSEIPKTWAVTSAGVTVIDVISIAPNKKAD